MDSRFTAQATKPMYVPARKLCIEQDVHMIVEHPNQEGGTITVQESLD